MFKKKNPSSLLHISIQLINTKVRTKALEVESTAQKGEEKQDLTWAGHKGILELLILVENKRETT